MFIIPALICSAISIGWKARLLAKKFAARTADLDAKPSMREFLHGRLSLHMFVERYKLHVERTRHITASEDNQYRKYEAYAYILLAATEVRLCVCGCGNLAGSAASHERDAF